MDDDEEVCVSKSMDETLDDTCSFSFLVSSQTGRGLTVRKYTQTLDDVKKKRETTRMSVFFGNKRIVIPTQTDLQSNRPDKYCLPYQNSISR